MGGVIIKQELPINGQIKEKEVQLIGANGEKLGNMPIEKALEIAKKDHGLSSVDVYVKGIGLGRDSAIRAISGLGIRIDSITDITPIAHGGVRPKGERKP